MIFFYRYDCYSDYFKLLKKIQEEVDRIKNKRKLNKPVFRFKNEYSTIKTPILKYRRRNRLIGKREKRIGLKR